MSIYNRVRCSQCGAGYCIPLSSHKRQINCKCGYLIKIKPEKNYFIDYWAYGKRVREKVGPSKALAQAVYHKRMVEIIENKFFGVKKQVRMKFEDFVEEYVNIHVKPNLKAYERSTVPSIKKLCSYFKGKFLHEISVKHVEQFKAIRREKVSPATVNRQLAILKSMFNRAKEWDMYQGDNPVCKVKFFQENNQRVEYLREDEIKRIIEVSEDYLRPILIVAINTGMRRGEILALKWSDIDFQTGTIYIREAKSGKGRTVPMNNNVRNALSNMPSQLGAGFIFTKRDGERRFDLRKPFDKALKNAGITRYFRFHDLRHTFASQLAMKGVSLNTIRDLLGHESLEMTMRYSHLSPEHNRGAVTVLDSI